MNLFESIKTSIYESDNYKLRVSLTNDDDLAISPSAIVTNKNGTQECIEYLRALISSCNTAEELAETLNNNRFPDSGDKRIFYSWTPVSTERDVVKRICTNAFLNKIDDIKYDRILTVESYDKLDNHYILIVHKDGVSVKD